MCCPTSQTRSNHGHLQRATCPISPSSPRCRSSWMTRCRPRVWQGRCARWHRLSALQVSACRLLLQRCSHQATSLHPRLYRIHDKPHRHNPSSPPSEWLAPLWALRHRVYLVRASRSAASFASCSVRRVDVRVLDRTQRTMDTMDTGHQHTQAC